MNKRLEELAKALEEAIASDTPRQTMAAVAQNLRQMAAPVDVHDTDRDTALSLISMIEGHQYGLKFGDGSLRTGRNLSASEQAVITRALRAYGTIRQLSAGPIVVSPAFRENK